MPTISACLMVRNERHFLPICLANIQNLCDEIVVVDTGSTDNTIEIAKSFGAKIFNHPWKDDFSEARNHTLEHATGDYCLIFDADETIEPLDFHLFPELLAHPENIGYFFRIRSELESGAVSESLSVRLFQNHKGFHYEGIVHNQLVIPIEKCKATDIRLYHKGYALSKDLMIAKHKRTMTLLKKQIAEKPEDPFPHYNAARMHLVVKEWKLAESEARETIFLFEKTGRAWKGSCYPSIFHSLFLACFGQKKYENCVNELSRINKEFPEFLDPYFGLGTSFCFLNRELDAAYWMEQYFAKLKEYRSKPWLFNTEITTADYSSMAHFYLALMYARIFKFDWAQTHYMKAISLNPKCPDSYMGLGEIEEHFEYYDEAKIWYECALSKDKNCKTAQDGLIRLSLRTEGNPNVKTN